MPSEIFKLRATTKKEVITLRKATINDLMFLYNLRNEESVRNASFNSNPIDLQSHKNWFGKKLKDPQTLILIGEIDNDILPARGKAGFPFRKTDGVPLPRKAGRVNKKIGQIRFDIKEGFAEVSLAVNSSQRGKGYGLQLLAGGCQYAFNGFKMKKIIALIKPGNKSSFKVFSKANFIYKGYSQDKPQKCIKMVLEKSSK